MNTLNCDITSIEYYNHDTRRIMLKVPTGHQVEFLAGQYLQVKLAAKMCPFSIASAPALSDRIELHIRPTADSEDSVEIEKLLDEASCLEIELPLGECFLTSPPSGPLMLLAASTGITQMKSMLEHILPQQIGGNQQPIYLYWGVVNDKDLYLTELCEQWQADYPNFQFIPVVSEPENSPHWQGKTGLVGDVALADMATAGISDFSDLQVIVGGGPDMVYAILDQFIAAGLPENNMKSDVFSYAPR